MSVKEITQNLFFLQQKSVDADQNDLAVAQDLKDTLLAREDAAGLAANMIGKNKRIIAFKVGPLAVVMLNPKIVKQEEKYLTEEGCLSLKGMRKTTRFKQITVQYQDEKMDKKTQDYSGFIAEVIQHEIDHCNGKLI